MGLRTPFVAALAAGMLTGCAGQVTSGGSAAQTASDGGVIARVPVGDSPVRGPNDAWVTLVEFGDYECPFCGEAEPVVEALLAEYGADLRLVFKNFPLTSVHPYAQGGAVAAECAAAQGDFWPMHDALFANQTALEPAHLPAYAAQAGVADMAAWQACLSTSAPLTAIASDVAEGNAIGVDGTPTFVVNGTVVVGAQPQSTFEALIETKRAEAQASGVPRGQYYATVVLGGH